MLKPGMARLRMTLVLRPYQDLADRVGLAVSGTVFSPLGVQGISAAAFY